MMQITQQWHELREELPVSVLASVQWSVQCRDRIVTPAFFAVFSDSVPAELLDHPHPLRVRLHRHWCRRAQTANPRSAHRPAAYRALRQSTTRPLPLRWADEMLFSSGFAL